MSYFDDNESRITGINIGSSFFKSAEKAYNQSKENKQMNITILNVTKTPATSKAGKPYTFLDLAFKNNTYGGKVEGKKLMPFGDNANAFKALENGAPGESFDINVVKNAAGFNDWLSATLAGTGAGAPPAASPPAAGGYANKTPSPNNTAFEEREAKKQVYIIRQSSVANAVAALSVGSKSALKLDEVTAYASGLVDFVLGSDKAQPTQDSGFDDLIDDVPL